MDKIDDIVRGVKFLAPGIIVVFIFYMFSNVQLDEFAFLLLAASSVILISFATDAFLILLSELEGFSYSNADPCELGADFFFLWSGRGELESEVEKFEEVLFHKI